MNELLVVFAYGGYVYMFFFILGAVLDWGELQKRKLDEERKRSR